MVRWGVIGLVACAGCSLLIGGDDETPAADAGDADTGDVCDTLFTSSYIDLASLGDPLPDPGLMQMHRLNTNDGSLDATVLAHETLTQTGADALVFRFESLNIPQQARLDLEGPGSVVFVVDGQVRIAGHVFLGSTRTGGQDGAGASTACPGPDGTGNNEGGGGGGYGQGGGGGGGAAGTGGMMLPVPAAIVGGCTGGMGAAMAGVAPGVGGRGGGALLIVAAEIIVTPQARIEANGAGGRGGNGDTNGGAGGGGGGSGGMIALQASCVDIPSGARLSANGGGGGAGGGDQAIEDGTSGQDGQLGATAALGGPGGAENEAGGAGGVESSIPGSGIAGDGITTGGGGGGGGVGYILVSGTQVVIASDVDSSPTPEVVP